VPAQFELVVYFKTSADLEELARQVFRSLGGGDYTSGDDPSFGGEFRRLDALGLEATLFQNQGEMLDEDFDEYAYGLLLAPMYIDPDLELAPVEAPLAEYFARLLAFHSDAEVATSIYLGSQDGLDLYEIRAFKRNPQFVPNSGPTSPRVYISERRTVEYEADEDLADEDGDDEGPGTDEE